MFRHNDKLPGRDFDRQLYKTASGMMFCCSI